MSGTESAYGRENFNIDPTELDLFSKSGAEGANRAMDLLGASAEFTYRSGGDKSPTNRYFGAKGQQLQGVEKLYGDFNRWKSADAQFNKEYLDYVDSQKNKKGRGATVLVDSASSSGSVLGNIPEWPGQGKTVLG